MSVKLEDANINRFDKITRIANLNPLYCRETDSLSSVIDKILELKHRRIPVVSKDMVLTGIVTYMDILDGLLRGQTKDMQISSIMVRDIISCDSDDMISYVLQKLKMSRRGGIPITRNKRLIGIVSEKDFVRLFAKIKFDMPVKDAMTPRPFFISKRFSILDCLKSMVNTHYRRLPVVENNTLIGIVTAFDIVEYIREHDYDLKAMNEPLDFVVKDAFTISEKEDVSDVVNLMKDKDIGGLLVVKDKKLEGIITERDILEQIV